MKTILALVLLLFASTTLAQNLGTLRTSPFDPSSVHNPFGAGSPFNTNGLRNPYSPYGSPFSNRSWTNPYATQAPRIYEGNQYLGRLSTSRFEPDSTSNPFGRYGSPFSPDSINNPFGAGSPFGRPLTLFGD